MNKVMIHLVNEKDEIAESVPAETISGPFPVLDGLYRFRGRIHIVCGVAKDRFQDVDLCLRLLNKQDMN